MVVLKITLEEAQQGLKVMIEEDGKNVSFHEKYTVDALKFSIQSMVELLQGKSAEDLISAMEEDEKRGCEDWVQDVLREIEEAEAK